MTPMMIRYWLIVLLLAALLSPAIARANPCAFAPSPRLRVGMTAVVSQAVDVLNVRALPAVGTGIRARITRGTPLTVLDGPSCNRALHWYRVELANGLRGWVAEGTWSAYYLIPEGETRPPSPIAWSCPQRGARICPEA